MAITKHVFHSPRAQHAVDLTYQVVGMIITVKAGTLRIIGRDVVFTEDFGHEVPSSSVERYLKGFLVRNKTTDEITVVVDEILLDGTDEPFDFKTSDYESLMTLYEMAIPADTVSLEALELKTFAQVDPTL